MSTKRLKTRRADRRGASAVEFAIVGPVVFLVIFGCLELVRLGMLQGIAEDAAYEAARFVMVPGATKDEGVAEANRLLALLGTQNATVIVDAYGADGLQPEINDFTRRVTVSIEIPVADNALIIPKYATNRNISTSSTLTFESYEGYYDGSSN